MTNPVSVTTPTNPSAQSVSRSPYWKAIAVVPFVLVAVGAAAIGVYTRVPDGKIANGVHVQSLDIGGKTLDEARTALEEWAKNHGKTQILLTFKTETGIKKKWSPDAFKIGLGVNVNATLDTASKIGRDNILGQAANLIPGAKLLQVAVEPMIDENKLKAYLEQQVAKDMFQKPKNAQFMILHGGGFGSKHELNGQSIDIEKSLASVKKVWTATKAGTISTGAEIPQTVVKPVIEPAVVKDAPAKPDPAIDPAQEVKQDTTIKPVEPEKKEVAPAPPPTSNEGVRAILEAKIVKPAITFEDVGQIDGLLASRSSSVGGTSDRLNNIRVAASHINRTLLKPGQIFSYNSTVGPRNEDSGFREAPILVRGRHDKGIGGGICQTSGTLFGAVLKAGLKIVQREPHSIPIPYLPTGLDATVSYGSIDFQFQNDTHYPVYIQASLSGRSLYFAIYGKKEPGRTVSLYQTSLSHTEAGSYDERDSSHYVGYSETKERGSRGCRVSWERVIKQDGQILSKDTISSRYRAVPSVRIIGTKSRPARKPKAVAAPKSSEAAAPTTTSVPRLD